ncbi:MAG: response regulator [Candidatus Omnitrophica bacterium]|nr:response regulator [Candidatus Omnitrophota bacterium]
MSKKRILIVDDEADLVKMIALRLRQADFEVLVAYDGQEGLEKARKEVPDLILLDLMLPKLDGYKVCRLLKFDQKYKDIPIVILTARGEKSDEELVLEAGADAYITKPYQHEVMLAKINEFLKK